MIISTLLMLFLLLIPASVPAGTILYTDSHHPPIHNDTLRFMIYLDAPVQTLTFGELP
ncbi:hypothetical protein NFL61_01895 [Enterobacter ludwigii]|uniref:hypothetical protein n=1 Tax=Enterobacter ludwigii TaxID=299767 RepID=UPI0024318EEE|nr:hypothetical protein [Enterobacter ludwigii]WGC20721.1 hypothetical protein NFL61_01895 [Enterobacter ludwigii]